MLKHLVRTYVSDNYKHTSLLPPEVLKYHWDCFEYKRQVYKDIINMIKNDD